MGGVGRPWGDVWGRGFGRWSLWVRGSRGGPCGSGWGQGVVCRVPGGSSGILGRGHSLGMGCGTSGMGISCGSEGLREGPCGSGGHRGGALWVRGVQGGSAASQGAPGAPGVVLEGVTHWGRAAARQGWGSRVAWWGRVGLRGGPCGSRGVQWGGRGVGPGGGSLTGWGMRMPTSSW